MHAPGCVKDEISGKWGCVPTCEVKGAWDHKKHLDSCYFGLNVQICSSLCYWYRGKSGRCDPCYWNCDQNFCEIKMADAFGPHSLGCKEQAKGWLCTAECPQYEMRKAISRTPTVGFRIGLNHGICKATAACFFYGNRCEWDGCPSCCTRLHPSHQHLVQPTSSGGYFTEPPASLIPAAPKEPLVEVLSPEFSEPTWWVMDASFASERRTPYGRWVPEDTEDWEYGY